MKLNNHGWGMKEMIIYSCLLLLFLLIAIFFIHSLYSELEKDSSIEPNDNKDIFQVETDDGEDKQEEVDYSVYYDYEEKMADASRKYVIDKGISLNTNIETVTLNELVQGGYIDQLYDQEDKNPCNGYSNVWDNEEGEYEVDSFISCPSYVTEGY